MMNLFGLYFNFWLLIVLIAAGLGVLYLGRIRKFRSDKTLFFSDVADFAGIQGFNFSALTGWLFCISLFFFAIACIDPHTFTEKQGDEKMSPPTPTEGIAIYLVLDKSGSMGQEVETPGRTGRKDVQTKLALMKQVTETFIANRPADLIGLVAFARQADVLAPLTLDHASVTEALQGIEKIPDRDMDGTAIGYAIYKTVSLIDATRTYNREKSGKGRSAYEIKNNVIVLVTDGLQDPNPLDQGNRLRTIGLDEAAQYAEEKGVKLYIINVEPQIATERYAAQRRQLERITKLTGGRFYIVDSSRSLEKVYSDINRLEKSLLPAYSKDFLPELYQRNSFYPWFVAWGLAALIAAIICQTVVFRRVP